MGDLRGLIDAVENGDRWDNNALYRLLGVRNAERAIGAFRGSLDAAKALHEALLPGWIAKPQIGGAGAGVTVWHCTIEDWDSGAEIHADNMPCPTRAWLLAILRALEAEGKA